MTCVRLIRLLLPCHTVAIPVVYQVYHATIYFSVGGVPRIPGVLHLVYQGVHCTVVDLMFCKVQCGGFRSGGADSRNIGKDH